LIEVILIGFDRGLCLSNMGVKLAGFWRWRTG